MGVYELSGAGGLISGRTEYKSMNAGNQYGGMVPIATVTLSSAGGIQFFNVPQTFQDLFVVASLRGEYAAALDVVLFEWGYTTNYSYTALRGTGSAADSYRGTGAYGIYCNSIPAASSTSGIFGSFEGHILNYANTTNYKTAIVRQAFDLNGSGGTSLTVGMKNTTAAVTFVEIGGGNNALSAGSTATLYGIRAVSS
jgi:hypothetical protein